MSVVKLILITNGTTSLQRNLTSEWSWGKCLFWLCHSKNVFWTDWFWSKKLKVNLFIFWCIYVKVSWTKTLRLNNIFRGKSYESQFQVKIHLIAKSNSIRKHTNMSKSILCMFGITVAPWFCWKCSFCTVIFWNSPQIQTCA